MLFFFLYANRDDESLSKTEFIWESLLGRMVKFMNTIQRFLCFLVTKRIFSFDFDYYLFNI